MRFMAPLLLLLVGIATSFPSIAGAAGEPGSEHMMVAPIESDGVQRLTMVLDSYSYDPNHVVVQAGRPVELILNSVTMITPVPVALARNPRTGPWLPSCVVVTVPLGPAEPTGGETRIGTIGFTFDSASVFWNDSVYGPAPVPVTVGPVTTRLPPAKAGIVFRCV